MEVTAEDASYSMHHTSPRLNDALRSIVKSIDGRMVEGTAKARFELRGTDQVRLCESYQNIKEKERHDKAGAEARRERKEKANTKKKRTLRTRTSGTQSSGITRPRG